MAEGKKIKKQVNGNQLFNEIKSRISEINHDQVRIVVEACYSDARTGVTSMFNFGQSFGVIKGICSAILTSFIL